MAAFELLLSHARRQCFLKPPSPLSLLLRSPPSSSPPPTFLGFRRLLSSSPSPSPDSNPDAPRRRPPEPVPVAVVSYAVKPEVPSKPNEQSAQPPPPPSPPPPPPRQRDFTAADARSWTREDIRYVKDAPSISPVSYPTRTAPLPEDRAAPPPEEDRGQASAEEGKEKDAQLRRERERIDAGRRVLGRVTKVEEEKVPFPTLITVKEEEKQRVIYDLAEAIRQVKANAKRNFDETVEAHVKLGLNMRRTDLTVRGAVSLPHGIGKAIRVAVFADGAAADEARAAGADIVGGVELVEEIKSSKIVPDVDRCISTELFMERLKKLSTILRHLMPNPRKGSVTNDVAAAVKEAKQGLIEFKMDKTAIVHVGLGKVSFSEESLRENIGAFVNALLLAKPAGLKKTSKYAGYVNSFHICSTMGPGFPVSIQSLSLAADHHNKLYPR